jgi:hypothetical protein
MAGNAGGDGEKVCSPSQELNRPIRVPACMPGASSTPAGVHSRGRCIRSPQGYLSRLGVQFGAEREAIDKNYKKLARKYHPDKNPSKTAVEEFQKITTACNACQPAPRV